MVVDWGGDTFDRDRKAFRKAIPENGSIARWSMSALTFGPGLWLAARAGGLGARVGLRTLN